jgi:large subunit ribosomal protein L22
MQQFIAKARYVRYSPFKLRPLVDVIRGKSAEYALSWLATYGTRRSSPIQKVVESAIANAQHALPGVAASTLKIADIRVDQGPTYRYFKPTARGSASIQRKRFSHLSVILQSPAAKKKQSNAKEA